MATDGDPQHTIIDRPHEFRIGTLHYHVGLDGQESHLDLHLHRGDEVRRLRFYSPQDIEIEKGFPLPTGGMVILDVTGRQMEGLRVRVADFEASWGSITYWAREVVDLDAAP